MWHLRSPSRFHLIYITTWAGLATGAMLYVLALILSKYTGSHAPDPYAGSQTIALSASQSKLRTSRAEAIAELATRNASRIRNDVYEVQNQVTTLMSRLAAIEMNTNKINKKVASLEGSSNFVTTAALPAQSVGSAGPPKTMRDKKFLQKNNPEEQSFNKKSIKEKLRETKTSGKKSSEMKPRVMPKPAPLTALPAGIVVRTLPLPKNGFGDRSDAPPVLKVAAQPLAHRIIFGVHLGSGNSIDMLRSEWNLVRARYATYLSELEGRYLSEPATKGATYQLIAGPFSNAADAIRLCVRLKAGNGFCKPTIFTGKSL